MVEQLLKQEENKMHLPSQEYYGYMKVDKLTVIDQELYCIITGPLFDAHTHVELTVKTLPMCTEEHCAKLHQPPSFIIDYETEDLYFPDECFGPTPKACRPGVVYDKRHLPCLHGLINRDPTQQKQCPLTYYLQAPAFAEVTTGELNRYLVSTENTLYHQRCPNTKPVTGKLNKGHYLIDMQPRCVLDTNLWMIRGLPTIQVNLTVERPPPEPIDLSWFKIPNHTNPDLNLPAGIKKLNFPNYTNLHEPPVTDIVSEIDEIQKNVETTPVPWYIWLAVAVAATIGFIFLICCLSKVVSCGIRNEAINPKPNSKFQSPKGLKLPKEVITHQPVKDPIAVYDSDTQTISIVSKSSFRPVPNKPTADETSLKEEPL